MSDEDIALAALRQIAGLAITCLRCAMQHSRREDAVALGARLGPPEVGVACCRSCLESQRDIAPFDLLTPITQPVAVDIAREALAQIKAFQEGRVARPSLYQVASSINRSIEWNLTLAREAASAADRARALDILHGYTGSLMCIIGPWNNDDERDAKVEALKTTTPEKEGRDGH